MKQPTLKPSLWAPRPVEETVQIYTDWAQTYEADLVEKGYATPQRIARALAQFLEPGGLVLDFGCGTGMSGLALQTMGLGPLHGCDITAAMVDLAKDKAIYDKLWVSNPGEPPQAGYAAIVATGVISLSLIHI